MRDWIEYLLLTVPPQDCSNFALCLPTTIDVLRIIDPIAANTTVDLAVVARWERSGTAGTLDEVEILAHCIKTQRQVTFRVDQGGNILSHTIDEKMVRTESDREMPLDDVRDAAWWCVGQK